VCRHSHTDPGWKNHRMGLVQRNRPREQLRSLVQASFQIDGDLPFLPHGRFHGDLLPCSLDDPALGAAVNLQRLDHPLLDCWRG
jgi:hypothetical protein